MDIDKHRDDGNEPDEKRINPPLVYKVRLAPSYGKYTCNVPDDWQTLGMSIQDTVVIWGRVHINNPRRDRVFLVGHPDLILPERGAHYIGTWQQGVMSEKSLVLTSHAPENQELKWYEAHIFDMGWKDELEKNVG